MQDSQEVEIKDRFYGKESVKIVQVEKNGALFTIKEYQVGFKMTLSGVKEYMSADNSDIICADACKNAIYILANNHGIKSPEEFGMVVCNHFLSTYSHMTKVCTTVEDFSWNRISYEAQTDGNTRIKLHNHAFIHRPECIRTCSVTLERKDMALSIKSGLKNLNLVKTSQASFIGFLRDEYTLTPELYERVLSTNVSCTWSYFDHVANIDYDGIWKAAKDCIIKSWGGDPVEGVLSSCMQFTLQTAGKNVLDLIPEISSINLLMPNILYGPFDFEKFSNEIVSNEDRKVFTHIVEPVSLVAAKIERKEIGKI